MNKAYQIKIVNRKDTTQFVICASTYKSLEAAKARREYEAWKYGKAYSVEIWEVEEGCEYVI